MHYYKFNLKDWASETAHLTLVEEGIYRRLVDLYYASEEPLNPDFKILTRKIRATGYETEVSTILDEFFLLNSEGYTRKECEYQIAAYKSRAELNRERGKLGGRPKKTESLNLVNHEETREVSVEKPNPNPNHKPLTINNNKNTCAQPGRALPFKYSDVQDAYNEICGHTLPKCAVLNENRKRQIKAMCAIEFLGHNPFRQGLDTWRTYFTDCLTNPHWCGQNDRGWRADFDFITNPKNAIRLMEKMG